MNVTVGIMLCIALAGNPSEMLHVLQGARGKSTAPEVIHPEEIDIKNCEPRGHLEVMVGLKVTAEGIPDKVNITRSSGNKCFDQASLVAVRGYRYRPATRNGHPVEAVIMIGLSFDLPDQKHGRD